MSNEFLKRHSGNMIRKVQKYIPKSETQLRTEKLTEIKNLLEQSLVDLIPIKEYIDDPWMQLKFNSANEKLKKAKEILQQGFYFDVF